MIPFRPLLRHGYLSAIGKFCNISPSVHILNGHIIGIKKKHCKEKFQNLLKILSQFVDFINIEKACQLILEKQQLMRPAIAFTFDDGFEDCYFEIAPVLEEFGINAAFFINPNFTIGNQAYILNFLKEKAPHLPFRKPMNTQMVRELYTRGFVIGAHSLDHERLLTNNMTFLQQQIKECRIMVETMINAPCEYFAWPYGKYSDISCEALLMIGNTYKYNFSSDQYSSYTSNKGSIFNRRHFECDWSASHIRYFLSINREYERY